MKKFLLFMLLPALILTLSNCERKGTVTDMARIKQADRAAKIIKNALEEYYLKHETYPEEGGDLRQVLLPYVQKVLTANGDSVSKWDTEIQLAFSEGPFYSTTDPKLNYFLRAQARDLNKTPVFVRPSIIRKKEEEKKKGK